MTPLLRIIALTFRSQRSAMLRGMALSFVVLAAGAALLGLSGWFITAAGFAGIIGLGIDFNIWAPGASVRGLALGRTAARYGERMLTHDATLKSLTAIRVKLLRGVLAQPFQRLSRLRGAETLNRLVADVNALDGVSLRLFIPAVSAVALYLVGFALLWWLVDLLVAAWIVAVYAVGASGALGWVARRGKRPSRMAEKGLQAFRIRLIDLLRARDDLAVYGRLAEQTAAVHGAEDRLTDALRTADRAERRAGIALSLTATLAAGGALLIGGLLAQAEVITPAKAALGLFAALAMAEANMPLRRGLADLGRMQDAARRVTRLLPDDDPADTAPLPAPARIDGAPALSMAAIRYRHPGAAHAVLDGFDLTVPAGATLALTGPSGGGKSTVLSLAAGLITPDSGQIALFGTPMETLEDGALRSELAFLPQRSAILGTSFFEVLALADPALDDAGAERALQAVALDDTVARRGGLHAPLRENGAGLSGGEQRRLALARALLRKPRLLLLDEPTEGLDRPTAARALSGLRAALPQDCTILTASHRQVEKAWADDLIPVQRG